MKQLLRLAQLRVMTVASAEAIIREWMGAIGGLGAARNGGIVPVLQVAASVALATLPEQFPQARQW